MKSKQKIKRANAKDRKAASKPLAAKISGKQRPMSTLDRLEAMLRQPDGATIRQMAEALVWRAHSVRGAMSGALKKRRGLKIVASGTPGKHRIYRIAS
jgi:hypothetical protein